MTSQLFQARSTSAYPPDPGPLSCLWKNLQESAFTARASTDQSLHQKYCRNSMREKESFLLKENTSNDLSVE
jgi:hypothetical protein